MRLLRSVASALGITTICCVWIVGPLIVPSHETIYHWSGPASTLFIPPTLAFIGVWIFFSFLLFFAQGNSRGSFTLWACITVFLPWAALKSGALLMRWDLPHWISRSVFALCSIAFFGFCVQRRQVHLATWERLRKLTIDVLCIVATSGAVLLVQLAWFGWQARRLNSPLPLHQITKAAVQTGVGHPRIIWILLDELSYQQVYGHRFHSLDLPAFDQLAKQSTVFTGVIPAGTMTEIVMPSLITGRPLDEIQTLANGVGLKLHSPLARGWKAFDQHDTIFSDALSAGYSTAIAGWYNPYCRILPEVLDHCFWELGRFETVNVLPRASISRNILNEFLLNPSIMDRLPSAIAHGKKLSDLIAESHISDYRQISDSADQLLRDSAVDFILIHMPVPHPGGIYNRRTHSFATRNVTYIDNLALADSYLGHVRSLLQAKGQWDSSAIVVMGDHSWRTELFWAGLLDWAPEEQEASNDNSFDDRPGYIVKLPGQSIGTTINMPFPATDTRRLFDGIMRKEIVSPEDLSTWVGTVNHNHPSQ